MLLRTSRRAGDNETERLCEGILSEEHAMADRLTHAFGSAVDATLQAVTA